MILLDHPILMDREGERLYLYAPGEVCVDICSGAKEDRARVMALLAQVQEMGKTIADVAANSTDPVARTRCLSVLRDAGVLP